MARPRKRKPLLDHINEHGRHRVFDRGSFTSPVILEDENGAPLMLLTAQDLSVGGLFLECPVAWREESHIFLSLVLPGIPEPIRVVGQVARVQRAKDSQEVEGFGVRFTELPTAVYRTIEACVTQSAQ